MNRESLEKHIICEVIVGSRLYGTHTETSDIDIRGILIPPPEYFLSPFVGFEQLEFPGEDKVIYGILKAFKLFRDANPNMLDVLFAPSKFWIKKSRYWEEIYDHRNKFLSTKIRHTFSGYAFAQLKRMGRHRSWLLNPPKSKPERSDFGLGSNPRIAVEQRKAVLSLPTEWIDSSLREDARKESEFHRATIEWNQYQEWIKERNPERAKTEIECGYDVKNALHLCRLMVMCEEILTTGEVNLVREDAEDLKLIKHGKIGYDELISWAEGMDKRLEQIYKSGKSPLSFAPDDKFLGELCQLTILNYWRDNGLN